MATGRSVLWRAARWYAARYGFAVFPLAPRTKVPLIPKRDGGRGLLDATTDGAQIDAWWGQHPEANIGASMGSASKVWALDVDPRNGGTYALDALEAQFTLPDTPESLTGGGGRHVLFRYEPALDDVQWLPLEPGLDAQGTGHYIVLPPSIHPSGKPYVWELAHRIDALPVAPTPGWLRTLLLRHRRSVRTHVDPPSTTDPKAFTLGAVFSVKGWLGPELRPGVWAVQCPSESLHTTGERFDTSTVLFAPGTAQSTGWLYCSHSHCHGLYPSFDYVMRGMGVQRPQRNGGKHDRTR